MNIIPLRQKPHSRFQLKSIVRGLSLGSLAFIANPEASHATDGVLVATGQYYWKYDLPIPGKWKQVWRYDPPDQVTEFQLTVTFPVGTVAGTLKLDTEFGVGGISARVPFGVTLTDLTGLPGQPAGVGVLKITGSRTVFTVGGVDLFELYFDVGGEPDPAVLTDLNSVPTLPPVVQCLTRATSR